MDATIAVAVIAATAAMASAFFTYQASTKATSVENKKVDQTAYDRAIDFYNRQLDDANKQIDRVTAQLDRMSLQLEKMSIQLANEKDVSNTLRNQIKFLESQVEILKTTIADLRGRMGQKMDVPGKG